MPSPLTVLPPGTRLSLLLPQGPGEGLLAGSSLSFPRGSWQRIGSRSQAHPALCLQVTPFPEAYRETLHAYKISEQDTDVRANVRAACPPSAPDPTCPVPCNEPGRLETLPGTTRCPIYPTPRAVPWLHPVSPGGLGSSRAWIWLHGCLVRPAPHCWALTLPSLSLSYPGAEAAGEALRAEQGAAGAGEAGAAAPSGEGSWRTQSGDSSGGTFVGWGVFHSPAMVPAVSMH